MVQFFFVRFQKLDERELQVRDIECNLFLSYYLIELGRVLATLACRVVVDVGLITLFLVTGLDVHLGVGADHYSQNQEELKSMSSATNLSAQCFDASMPRCMHAPMCGKLFYTAGMCDTYTGQR